MCIYIYIYTHTYIISCHWQLAASYFMFVLVTSATTSCYPTPDFRAS